MLCAGGAEPKIVYSRPFRNDAATTTATMVATGSAESAETDDDGATTAAPEKTTTVAVAAGGARVATAAMPVTRSRYAEKDSAKSMSAKAEHYGIQFYAPPVIHGPAAATVPAAPTGVVDAFGRPVLQRHVHTTPLQATYHQHHHRTHHRPQQWDPTAAMVQQQVGQQHGANSGGESGSNPSLMNPLLAAYGDPSTVRYSPTTRTRPVARLVKYTEPTTLGFQLPFLAAEADDGALLENLPALQLALQHAASTGKLSSPSITAPSTAPLHHLYQQPHHHHKVLGYHQLHHQPHHHHHPHQYHYPHQHGHRYAPTRYTQVPFLYNVPAPPPLQAQRQPAPAEYDLVTRFNRLLKEREREGLRKGAAAAAAAAEQDQGQPEEAEEVAAEDEEEETTARPVQTTTKKPAKKKKRKRKRRPRPSTPEPAPVVEEEEEDDRPAVHQHDERSINEQEAPEEQESQNVPDHEKVILRFVCKFKIFNEDSESNTLFPGLYRIIIGLFSKFRN